ncbi:MAG TPA: alpha/beta fold hydrolase [Kiritimatiellia bacterium]|nr:alpha/beta fold hydrolase [Kiritimatiellia bacterium]HMO99145.1 alpha/beta fold hydrolase [Kiritimatiellia bacterium]HMP95677.1 alpha/beta fold hydrolase [Kiritimatiellia bacterium]
MGLGTNKSLKRLAILLAIGLVLVNFTAWRNARFFFHYADRDAEALPRPESLTWSQKIKLGLDGIRIPKPQEHDLPNAWGLPFEEIMLPGRDGLELAAWRIPAEDPDTTVLLYHGYNSEKSGLLPEAKLFSGMGHQVILIDFPGAGDSPGNTVSLGIFEARDVVTTLDWARATYPDHRIILYGHSMGAAAVLRAMARHGATPDAAIIESVFDSLVNALRQRFRLVSLPPWPAADLLLFWGSVDLRTNGFDHRPVDFAAAVTIPTMVIHGREDDRALWKGAEVVYNRLAGKKDILLIDKAEHANICLMDPELWTERVQAFIQSVSLK